MLTYEIKRIYTEVMMRLTQKINNDIIKTNKLLNMCDVIINSVVTEPTEMDNEIETKTCEEVISILHITFTLNVLKKLLDNNFDVSCIFHNKAVFLVYNKHIYNLSRLDEIYNENFFILIKENIEKNNITHIETPMLKEIFKNKDISKYLDETIDEYELYNIFCNQVNLLITAKG